MIASLSRRFAAALAVLLIPISASAAAVTYDYRVLIDADNDATTGCTVVTASGLFKGVEQVVTTHVLVNGASATVTGVSRQSCTDPVANLFSSDLVFDGGGWSVGLANGTQTVETHVPMSVLGTTARVRLGFTVTSGTQIDDISSSGGAANGAILYPAILPPHHRAAGKATARVITLDGQLSDWDGLEPVAFGGSLAAPSLRLLNAWAFMGETEFYFAITSQTNNAAPTANDDNYSVVSGGTLGIAVPGVLTNDTDPNHKPLTAALVNDASEGALTLNADGSFTYTNNGGPATVDHFQYKANNGTLDSNTALVTIDIPSDTAPPPVKPAFTSPDHATFQAGTAKTFHITTTPDHPAVTVNKQSGTLPSGLVFTE